MADLSIQGSVRRPSYSLSSVKHLVQAFLCRLSLSLAFGGDAERGGYPMRIRDWAKHRTFFETHGYALIPEFIDQAVVLELKHRGR